MSAIIFGLIIIVLSIGFLVWATLADTENWVYIFGYIELLCGVASFVCGCYIVRNENGRQIEIDNVKSFQVDTTYTINKDKTDTTYVIRYIEK